MNIIVSNENPFSIPSTQFAISAADTPYTLSYSANGEEYTDYDKETPAGENCVVNFSVPQMYYKLKGHSGEVTVIY